MNKECEHEEICDCCDIDPEDCGYYKPKIDRDKLLDIADDIEYGSSRFIWGDKTDRHYAEWIRKACGVSSV